MDLEVGVYVMWEDEWASLKAREREKRRLVRTEREREREASWEWTMRNSMKVGDTSELQREIRHMRYEREREQSPLTSLISHQSPHPSLSSSPLIAFAVMRSAEEGEWVRYRVSGRSRPQACFSLYCQTRPQINIDINQPVALCCLWC